MALTNDDSVPKFIFGACALFFVFGIGVSLNGYRLLRKEPERLARPLPPPRACDPTERVKDGVVVVDRKYRR